MSVSFDYDSAFSPPAPIIEVGFSHALANTPALTIWALVDSGADVTILPLSLLKQSGASYVEQRSLRGVVGKAVIVHRYLAAVHIAGIIIRQVRIAGHADLKEAMIGRDILNQLTILLDGPAELLEIRTK